MEKKQTVEETLKSLQEAASAEEQKEILKYKNIVKTRKVMSKSQLFASDAGLYTDISVVERHHKKTLVVCRL